MVMLNQHWRTPAAIAGFILAQLCAKVTCLSAVHIAKSQSIKLDQGNNDLGVSRRHWIASVGVGATGALTFGLQQPPSAFAADTKLIAYRDDDCGFEFLVPSTWEKSEQRLPAPDRRKLVIFVDPASSVDKTFIFLAYTPVRDDFTSLSSFGSVDQVAQTTILPKGAVAGEETESKMLSAESKKQSYFFDYRAKPPGQVETHFRTIFSMAQGATGGAGSLLVTITAQTPESRYGEMKPIFDSVIDSYGKLA